MSNGRKPDCLIYIALGQGERQIDGNPGRTTIPDAKEKRTCHSEYNLSI